MKPIADYCVNEGINIGVEAELDMGWYRTYAVTESMKKYFQTILVLSDENGSASPDYDIALDDETKAHIARMRAWVAEEKMLEAERKRIAKEKEIAEYATLYEDNGQVPSSFVGLRNLDINVEVCPKYEAINNILKEAYKALGRDTHFSGVYDYFQKFGQDEEIIEGVNKVLCELKEKADALETIKSCNISLHDVYWGRFDVQRTDEKRNVSDLALIKMYLSAKDISDALAIFYDAVEFMIEEGRGLFHAKVTRISRDDQICMWVTREDFFVLEKYLKKYEDMLHRPLQFIPYRGSIGISREFYDWTSHNGVQAQLISTYFSSVDSVEKIDVVDMYSKYVKAWNGEFPEGDVFTRKFKESNAQEFIILIESFSLLFGITIIDDNNILLNGDGKLWHALGCSNNWYQLNKNLQIA